MNPLIQSKNITILPVLIALTLGCFALAPQAQAVCQHGCDTSNANTFLGDDALINNTTGVNNTANGFETLLNNTTGFNNTANGFQALFSNTTGSSNTAVGVQALLSNTTGTSNTATGVSVLIKNTEGIANTADGAEALRSNTTGSENTATGQGTLFSNTTGFDNTATGLNALLSNTAGVGNTATGEGALSGNTTGDFNTVTGHEALFSNGTGSENLAYGSGALFSNTTGNANAAYGGDGLFGNTTGSFNVAVGFEAGSGLTTGDNNINIGAYVSGGAGESNTIRIGTNGTQTATFVAGIRGVPITGGQAVGINGSGQLGIKPSSVRYKEAVQRMDTVSEVILAMRPVTFRYKKELDPKGAAQFGLVAEEVAKVNPDLVVLDDQGKPFTVRYEEVNAMLLNEFLKEHRKVEQLTKDVESKLAEQQKQIAVLTEGLQRVSGQIEVTKAAPQVVNNP